MEEVLDIYKRPYDPKHPVVCMDESSKQLTKETREPLPMQPKRINEAQQLELNQVEEIQPAMFEETAKSQPIKPGQVEKYDTEYERNGTASIFMAFEPLAGLRFTKITEQRTRKDWAEYIKDLVDNHYSSAEKIVFVMDNLNTHHKSSLYEAFDPIEAKRIADKIEIHYTPKHGSWLNMAEIELSHLNSQCLDRRIAERSDMSVEVASWTQTRNEKKVVANWQFTTADARIKLRKLYPTIDL